MKLAGRIVLIEAEWYGENGHFELNGAGRHFASLNQLEQEEWSACLYAPDRSKIFPTLPEAVEWVEQQLGVKP